MKLLLAACLIFMLAQISFADQSNVNREATSGFEITKWIFAVVGGMIGFGSKWFLDHYKIKEIKSKIEQLKSDVLTKRVELIEKTKIAEGELKSAQRAAIDSMKGIEESWQSDDVDGLIKHRNLLCETINDRVLPELRNVSELTVHRWHGRPDRQLSFMNNEVKEGMEQMQEWVVDIVNHPELLKFIGKNELRIKRTTLHRFYDIAEECDATVRDQCKQVVTGYINEITK